MKNDFIIVVAGEPKSIFLEVFFKALRKKKYIKPIILICNKKILIQQMKIYKFKKKIKTFNINNLGNYIIDNSNINLINVNFDNDNVNKYLKNSFDIAFKLIKKNFSNKFINGPINKTSFLNKKFLGITEYIAKKFKISKIGMLIYNKKLSVSPLTTHTPLKLVPKEITKKKLEEKIELINNFYERILRFKPRIAVTGLNPHCESILKFNEDIEIISKVINSKKKNENVSGPYPADTIFLKKNRKNFDVILGMYHDQVLTPIKTLFEFDAINITMGLPFLRISPDHGPNKKMFGKNKSNPKSIINALNFLDNI